MGFPIDSGHFSARNRIPRSPRNLQWQCVEPRIQYLLPTYARIFTLRIPPRKLRKFNTNTQLQGIQSPNPRRQTSAQVTPPPQNSQNFLQMPAAQNPTTLSDKVQLSTTQNIQKSSTTSQENIIPMQRVPQPTHIA